MKKIFRLFSTAAKKRKTQRNIVLASKVSDFPLATTRAAAIINGSLTFFRSCSISATANRLTLFLLLLRTPSTFWLLWNPKLCNKLCVWNLSPFLLYPNFWWKNSTDFSSTWKIEFSHLQNNVSWRLWLKVIKGEFPSCCRWYWLCGVNPIENSLPNILRAGREKNKNEIEQKMRILRLIHGNFALM